MAKRQARKKAPQRAKSTKKKATPARRPTAKASSAKKKAAKSKPRAKTASKAPKSSKGSKSSKAARKSSASAAKSSSAAAEPQKLVPVPLPAGVLTQRPTETNERSAHLEKLKVLFEAAPISRHLGMSLGYCENGVARVRLPFRKDFEEGHGVIHGGLIGLLGDTAGNFAVGSVSPGSNVKTVEFKLSLLTSVQGDLLAIGEVVRKGRTLATCRLEVVEGNDRVVAIGLATYALQAV